MKIDIERLIEQKFELVNTAERLRDTCLWQARIYDRTGDDEGARLQRFSAARADELIAYVTRRRKPTPKRIRKGGAK